MSKRAYTPATKADLLAIIEAGGSSPLVDAQADAARVASWARDVGLPAPLALLAAALAAALPDLPIDRSFVRNLLFALPTDRPLDALAHRWVGWVWRDANPSIHSQISAAPLAAIAADIVRVHDRATTGATFEPKSWRPLRTALDQASAVALEEDADAVAVIGASAWDFRTIPGAAADVLKAWEHATYMAIRRADGGSDEQDDRYRDLRRRIRNAAAERAGPVPDGADADAVARHARRFQEALSQANAASTDPLLERMTDRTHRIIAATVALRDQGKTALVSLAAD